jgi:hypothetical protein
MSSSDLFSEGNEDKSMQFRLTLHNDSEVQKIPNARFMEAVQKLETAESKPVTPLIVLPN